ncbi:MAG: PAS domain S-box protein [Elusimicrobiota bacterium]
MKRTAGAFHIKLASAALCAAVGAVLALQCRYDLRRERAEILRRLDNLAVHQSQMVEHWVENGRIDLRALLALPRTDGVPLTAYRSVLKRGDYVWIQYVDRAGRRVAGAFREAGPQTLPDARSVAAALRSPGGTMTVSEDAEKSRPVVDLALPDRGGGQAAGALFLRLDPRAELFPALESAQAFSATADTLLARRDGDEIVYLTARRGRPGPLMRLPVSSPRRVAAKAFRGEALDGTEVDYRGRRILAAGRRVSGTDWILIARVEAAEVSSPILRRALLQGAILVGLLLLATAAFLGFYRRREVLRQEAEFASKREILEKTRVLDAFFRHSLTPMVFLDRDFHYLRVNEAYAKACGKRVEDFHGRSYFDLYPHAENEEIFRQVVRTKTPHRAAVKPFEFPDHPEWGTTYWDWTLVPLLDLAGEVGSLVFSLENVSERVRAEEEHARLAAMVENSDDAIIGKTLDGVITSWNEGAHRLYGWTAAEALGGREARLFPPGAPDDSPDILSKIRRGEHIAPYETNRHRKDDRVMRVSLTVSPMKNSSGAVVGSSASARDVTPRWEAERKLAESEAGLKSAQAVARLGSWTLDAATGALSCSEEVYRLFGLPAGEPMTMARFLDAIPAEERAPVSAAWEAALKGTAFNVEHRIAANGGFKWVRELAEISIDASGRAVRGVGTVQDITELKRLQEQILHAQKMESVGVLAGGVAHDFNNILMTILGNCGFLLSSLATTDPRRADVEDIKTAGERAAALTRQLLIFSRKQKTATVVVDLNELIRNLQKMLPHIVGEDVKLETALWPQAVPVLADPGQLEQVIMNLAVNARYAMPRGGRLSLRTSRTTPGEACHRDCAAGEKGCARLEVSDTGDGMTPEVLAHLFEPFFTTKPLGKGTGLGLSTVYGIVRSFAGGIDARSAPGQGATFTIYLPLAEADVAAAAPAETPAAEARGRETILLVEDDEILRRMNMRLLLAHGYRVLAARDGEEALALLRDGGKDADLLLTDVVMPGIDGGELAREALKLKPGLKVIFASGYVEHAALERLQTTKYELLQKPVALDDLARKVREVLDRKAPA